MHLLLAAVIALLLPPHARIDPDQQREPIQVGPGGTIAATVTLTDASGAARIAVWEHLNTARLLSPPIHLDPGELSAGLALGGFDAAGTIYATLEKSMEMEAGGNQVVPGLYPSGAFTQLSLTPCASIIGSDFLPHIERVAGDIMYLTYESPDSMEVLQGDHTSDFAPYAVRLEGPSCTILGRASIRGLNGAYVVGFRGYLGDYIAPTDLNIDAQRYVAVRIHNGSLAELGPGVALAVASDGTAVGADAPSGVHESETESANGTAETFSCCTPHAMLWRPDGTPVALAPHARSSVAYAIDDGGRVAGMLIDAMGKHRAFLWVNGRLSLLDDIVRARGWRCEAAFAFGPQGKILGVGILKRNAAIFDVSAVPGG